MYEILSKEALNPTVVRIAVSAPRIARKAEPGQFVILRAKEQSERIPLTVADYDREAGTVTVIYQIVGAGTMELNTLNAGDCLHDLVGPLGTPTRRRRASSSTPCAIPWRCWAMKTATYAACAACA